jgi:hypothetical protein
MLARRSRDVIECAGDRAKRSGSELMRTLGFVCDYTGRIVLFLICLVIPYEAFNDVPAALVATALAVAIWFGSRGARYLLARHAIDPTLNLPLSWW